MLQEQKERERGKRGKKEEEENRHEEQKVRRDNPVSTPNRNHGHKAGSRVSKSEGELGKDDSKMVSLVSQ